MGRETGFGFSAGFGKFVNLLVDFINRVLGCIEFFAFVGHCCNAVDKRSGNACEIGNEHLWEKSFHLEFDEFHFCGEVEECGCCREVLFFDIGIFLAFLFSFFGLSFHGDVLFFFGVPENEFFLVSFFEFGERIDVGCDKSVEWFHNFFVDDMKVLGKGGIDGGKDFAERFHGHIGAD